MSPGPARRIVVAGGLVRRPARPWTPAVHALLRHLRGQGLTDLPEPLAVEGAEEVLRYVPGDAGARCWPHQAGLAGVASAARLLRRVHDATAGWTPPAGAQWAPEPELGAVGTTSPAVVCHGDPGPWNMVWRDGEAISLIDWDLAHPGPALSDVASALEWFAPFRPDDEAVRWHALAPPIDRRARIARFTRAYGLDGAAGWADAVIARQRATAGVVRALADQGVEPQRTWVRAGWSDELARRVEWSRDHRDLVEGGAARPHPRASSGRARQPGRTGWARRV